MPGGRKLSLDDPILTKRNISLDVELYKEVRAECVKMKYPLSFVICDLLQEWVDKRKERVPLHSSQENDELRSQQR